MMETQQCFYNSLMLSVQHDLIYCEGEAIAGAATMPIRQAWCVVEGSDQVIDPTCSDGVAYVGVPFKKTAVKEKLGQLYKDPDSFTDMLGPGSLCKKRDLEGFLEELKNFVLE